MRAVVQRVSRAAVRVDGATVGSIDRGLLALLGVAADDGPEDVEYVSAKLRDLRMFPDEAGRMNRSVVEIDGGVLLVSQFTLFGDVRRGRRPSFTAAGSPALAQALYEDVGRALEGYGLRVATGIFQAEMQVELVNDGPVTILLDSRKTF
jgi:D-aminoacyl-tRNA deacylase